MTQMNIPPWAGAEEWIARSADETRRQRQEMRERALYNATQLHCETGDSMAIFDRANVAAEVLATAQEFYDWITQQED
ncbi:hypothetical protein A5722_14705 [Mycobacterium vulneris]|nr:hypothetical protein A5722_14705 [Mycolicibacterium vulneris]OCB66179.1 hypothetical protein A5729_12210 [Mycolicibacterium vulneris]